MLTKFENNNVILSDLTDFDLAETLDCGQAFRWEENPDGSFSGVVKGKICRIIKNNNDFILENISEDDYNNIWCDYFDFKTDYAKIKDIVSYDEILKKACTFAPGIRVLHQEPWEALCSFIISQNNNIKRIKGIVKRLCEKYGDDLGNGFYSFPSADTLAKLTVDDLADLRSGFRARYIIDGAQKVANKEVDLNKIKNMPIDDARNELMKITGVGVKVADCTLLYGMNRIESFPKDVWIKRAITYLFPNGLPENALPYAGIVQQYIFHYIRICPDALPQEAYAKNK